MNTLHWLTLASLSAGSLLLAAYVAVAAVVAWVMTTARRRRPHQDAAWTDHPLQQVRLRPRGGSLRLAGSYVQAAGSERVVLFVHGKDCCRGSELFTSTHRLARSLVAGGFSVFMLDLRGHGDSGSARLSYGLHERDDVLGAFDWLVAKGYRPDQIGLFGASMGGACIIEAMAHDGVMCGPIVLDSTFARFDQMIERNFCKLSGMPIWLLPATLWWSRRLLGVDLRHLQPARALAACKRRPALVVHAAGDSFVTADHAHELASAAQGGLWLTGGRRHLASFGEDPAVYVERVVGFFARHLPSASPSAATRPAQRANAELTGA
jgi:alpha-beta hydrolase superfamily lysophospholipase